MHVLLSMALKPLGDRTGRVFGRSREMATDAQRLAGARVIGNCSPYFPRKVSGGPFGAAGVTIGIWRWERK